MQFQTAVEYQRFADRWFKCCVRVALDPVSALNSWWNSGSSFCFGLNDAIPVAFWAFSYFRCIQSPCFASFVWSPFADLVVSKDSDICWIFDGWMMDFCWVCKELSSKKRSAIVKWFVWTQLIEEDILGYYKKQGRAAKCPTSFSLFIVLAMSLKVITGTFNGGTIHQNITDE